MIFENDTQVQPYSWAQECGGHQCLSLLGVAPMSTLPDGKQSAELSVITARSRREGGRASNVCLESLAVSKNCSSLVDSWQLGEKICLVKTGRRKDEENIARPRV